MQRKNLRLRRTDDEDDDGADEHFSYDIDAYLPQLFALEGRSFPIVPWSMTMFITLCIVVVHRDTFQLTPFDKSINAVVQTAFGTILGFLLAFQAQQCSNRYWEARCHWEAILHNSREAYRVFLAHCNSEEMINEFGLFLAAFSILARNTLRIRSFQEATLWTAANERCPKKALLMILTEDNVARIMNGKNNLIRSMYATYACERILEKAVEHQCMPRPIERDIRPRLNNLGDALSGCEKILYTPMPWIYTVHLRFMMFVFLITLPLVLIGLDPPTSWYGILFYELVTSYAFLGLEDMAIEIQNPFGPDYSDLPLNQFVNKVFDSIKHMRPRYAPKDNLPAFDDEFERELDAWGADKRYNINMYNASKNKSSDDDDADGGD